MEEDEIEIYIEELKSGSTLIKRKKNGQTSSRRFYLDVCEEFLFCHDLEGNSSKSCRYNIRDINEVRVINENPTLQKLVFTESSCSSQKIFLFVLIYNNYRNQLHLLANEESTRTRWVKVLENLMKIKAERRQQHLVNDQKWILSHLGYVRSNKFQQISKGDSKKFLTEVLSVEIKENQFEQFFKIADQDEDGVLSSEEFVKFFHSVTRRNDLYQIMKKFIKREEEPTIDQIKMNNVELFDFLVDIQKQTIIKYSSDEDPENFEKGQIDEIGQVNNLIDEYEPDPNLREDHLISLDGFQNLLLSNDFSLMDPCTSQQVYQDMTKPLNHYYINTSHNTYLFDNQIIGESNPEAYNRALRAGCRAVEIDCHDGPDGFPIVKHGYTLVEPCSFESIIKAIEPNLFISSPYPVILDLENHCSSRQQKEMARILLRYLGDRLISEPLDNDFSVLPSPSDLKYRVILRGVKKETSEKASKLRSLQRSDREENLVDSESQDVEQNLSDLIIYLQNVPYQPRLEKPFSYQAPSLSERQYERLSRSDPNDLIKRTEHNVIRVYPDALRQDSSNPDPVDPWNFGVQMVALNHQTGGESMMFHNGKFRDNGACGYVLKPKYLNDASKLNFNPLDYVDRPMINHIDQPIRLILTVISGQFLMRQKKDAGHIPDPYVLISIRGISCDCQQQRTKFIKNNGLNPSWDATIEFEISFPQLATMSFQVIDYDTLSQDDCLGQFSLPVLTAQLGYRHVHLRTAEDQTTYSSLFVHIEIEPILTNRF